ncbi:TonB-dependent receptor [Sunxiuqinia rutila]|uniref:TonB-dependent receptor n=1 Tax=Sunxiuqinia rutila TaxID=1397841 RepID=UPI003D36E4B7
MKKIPCSSGGGMPALKKLRLIMRLNLFLLLISVFPVAAGVNAQNAKLNLKMTKATIAEVFDAIEQKSDVYFFYNKEEVDDTQLVDVEFKNKTLEEVLDYFEKNLSISSQFVGKNVIIKSQTSEFSVQQKRRITGKVTDASGQPLPGVTVLIKGTTDGTITDFDGNYAIAGVPAEGVLVFSFVGMRTEEILVAKNTLINVTMKEDAIGIEEVIAIGYGTAKKQDLTGAVATVAGEVISERKQALRTSQALQGAIPGLMVTRSGGAADASTTIRVRGITTIGDSNPLIIVDGIPGTLDWVNPNDIESISVLKDAASASIYGSRAAAGVILVTTKRAKKGQLSLDYSYEYGIDKPTRKQKMVDATSYLKMTNEQTWNDNFNQGTEFPLYSQELVENYNALHAENPDRYPDLDWIGLYLKDFAPRQSHKMNMVAGSEKIKSNVSVSYDNAEALYEGRNYERFMFRANNDITLNKYLKANIDFNGIYSINENPGYNYSFSQDDRNAPIYAAFWSDGRVAPGLSGHNVVARSQLGGFSKTKGSSISGKLAIDFTPFYGLTFTGVFSPQFYNSKSKQFSKQIGYTNFDDPVNIAGYINGATSTNLTEYRNDNISTILQFLGNYVKSLGKHNLNLMSGLEEYSIVNESLGATRKNFQLTSFPYINLGNENYQYTSGSASEYAYRSFFGRIMYNFNNRYFLQANARYDGSSRFARDHRWGLFPSFSAGWVVSEEAFMKGFDWLSFLKLRASWGTLGNERIGSYYPYQSTIGYNTALAYSGSSVVAAQTAAVTQYAIEDISWETTESYDVGIDGYFLDNKLKFSGDYYKKITKDMLLNLEIPNYIGLANPSQNTGKMNTKGWEIEISWRDKIGEVNYSVSFNLSDFKSVMGDLGGTEFLGNQVKFEGSEFNEWYGYKTDGLFQTDEEIAGSATINSNIKPGDIKYLDLSGPDGVPDGKISSEYDRSLLGGSLPRYLYGGNININYKSFDFGVVIQGVGKQNSMIQSNWVRGYRGFPEMIVNKYWSQYNTPEQNAKAQYPKLNDYTIFTANNYNSASDFWLFNGAYLRLKNINMAYNLPKAVVEKCGIQNARIYASISDLFSVDNYPKDWDPEASGYWITSSFVFGFSLKF